MTLRFSIKTFDELSPRELYDVLQLRSEVFVVEQQCIYLDADGKDPESLHVLGYIGSHLVACCRILPAGLSYNGYCSIGRVATQLEHRGKNYGRALMEEAIRFCLKQYTEPIKISAQAYLEKFYTGLGFKTVSATYLEDDIPHVAMVHEHSMV